MVASRQDIVAEGSSKSAAKLQHVLALSLPFEMNVIQDASRSNRLALGPLRVLQIDSCTAPPDAPCLNDEKVTDGLQPPTRSRSLTEAEKR